MQNSKKEKSFLILSTALTIASIALCTIIGVIKHDYWSYMIYEKSPIAWLDTFLLFSCCVITAINLFFSFKKNRKINIAWLILSIGFLYLTLDERFAIHESIRENILKPQNVKIDILFWVEKGDYVLIFLAIIGLMLTPIIIKEIRNNKKALIYFVIAIIFSLLAIGDDSIDLKGLDIGLQKLLQYIEEVCEAFGMLFYLNAFAVIFFEHLENRSITS